MAIPGLGLDQSQLADVINKQYKGYSQKQRNQMMQSSAATPDNWTSITNQANQTATQPTEFLGAGRTSNVPYVTQDSQPLIGYDSSNLSSLYKSNKGYENAEFDYTDSSGKGYFNLDTQKRIEAGAPNIISGTPYSTMYPNNPNTWLRPPKDGGYYFADPAGITHELTKINNNNFFVKEKTLGERTRTGTADNWMYFDKDKDLKGLSYGKFGGDTGLFFNPNKTDLSSLLKWGVNSGAYAKKGGGGGILGALNSITENFDPIGNFITNNDANILGFDNRLDMVQAVGEPVGNILGAIFSAGIPWGSIAMGAQNASTGNWDAVGQNAINGLASYAGSSISSSGTGGVPVEVATDAATGTAANSMTGSAGGVFGSGLNLGSTAANQMAQGIALNAMKNYATTGDMANSLKSAAFSGASGAAGNWLGNAPNSVLGEIGSKALGGAASGGLNSLFSRNSPIEGSLFGAMSGGLHGFLNSTARNNNSFNSTTDSDNKRIANQTAKLAKLFHNSRKK